ncbi:DUF7003 family protein [Micromonospora sp. DT44]
MRPADILEQLDAAAEEFRFPDLDNGYSYAVDARLHGYRDAGRRALVVETIGYSPRAGNLTGSRPSRSETFRQIADALATGDRTLYAPKAQPNTHWSHWPESGSL